MPVPRLTARHVARIDRIARTAVTVWYLAVQTASDIIASARHEWRTQHADAPIPALLRRLTRMCRYYLGCAVDPRTFFAVDGDHLGRRRADLDRVARQQRRSLGDLRRRHGRMLLRALGGNAGEVENTLTRHWQIVGDDLPCRLIEGYLIDRLRWRERPVHHEIDIFPWASNISGVWVATPAPVRRYLARADEHERRLRDASTGHPHRGMRPAPHPQVA
jgi:hypothetical protein